MTPDEITHRFTNHPPQSDHVSAALDMVTYLLLGTGVSLVDLLPDGREKSLAITKLEECSMWAKAAIARNQ
jgi:hypothetical protein